ncbi:2-succinyl-5-enolpyruvyl-6-hydroxy-3-cyclohexene-1-carboxylic-acid synthase [Bacteroidota bacterium]
MELSVNRNFIWSQVIVRQLADLGVQYVCISPGSRSTPLTLAFDQNDKIKKYILPDERSSGFFALGLTKKSKTPAAIVTTSGTAVAELYPAVIEAYHQRLPLIICTADRPAYLRGTGANQTINQVNIFSNHIRSSVDIGVPELKQTSLKKLLKDISGSVGISTVLNRGPVHLNFQFEKPLEPFTFTDNISVSFKQKIESPKFYVKNLSYKKSVNSIHSKVGKLIKKKSGIEKGIIICGPGINDADFPASLVKLARILNYPIFSDGASGLRFGSFPKSNVIANYTAFISSAQFQKNYDPEIIIHFGGAPTSKQLLEFYNRSNADKISISEYGEIRLPSKSIDTIITAEPNHFCEMMIKKISKSKNNPESYWLEKIKQLDQISANIKSEIIERSEFPFEGRIVTELFSKLRNNCNVMISNSMPIRDVDFFIKSFNKKINLFVNRGASGIDGIISTALGIAAASEEPTALITGDLAFYHDMNGLLAAMKYSIPLTIILINNNGGGIFESLPIAKEKSEFEKYFITPHNLDFAHFVLGYEGHYINARHWEHFNEQFPKTYNRKRFAVIEIKTDARRSAEIRKSYFDKVISTIDALIEDETQS